MSRPQPIALDDGSKAFTEEIFTEADLSELRLRLRDDARLRSASLENGALAILFGASIEDCPELKGLAIAALPAGRKPRNCECEQISPAAPITTSSP